MVLLQATHCMWHSCAYRYSHFNLAELFAMTADLAKSLTGSVAFTRRTKGMVTRGRFTGTTLGTGETRPRYSKSLYVKTGYRLQTVQ